jgi:hypothetical protein
MQTINFRLMILLFFGVPEFSGRCRRLADYPECALRPIEMTLIKGGC